MYSMVVEKIGEVSEAWKEGGIREVGWRTKLYLGKYLEIRNYKKQFGLGDREATRLAYDNETSIIIDFLSNLKSDDVFYDIGAAHGSYNIKAAHIIPPENVVAIEPGPLIEELKSRKLFYGFDGLTIIGKAVQGLGEKDVGFKIRQEGNKHPYVIPNFDSEEEVEEEEDNISTISGEEILSMDLPLPTVIKIDVAGWDLDVLKSLRPLIEESDCRLIYMEIEPPDATPPHHRHPDLHELSREELEWYFEEQWSFDEMLIILTELGFEVEYMMGSDGDLFIKAYR